MNENKLRELATKGDQDIDTSDAPELGGWDEAETGWFYRPDAGPLTWYQK